LTAEFILPPLFVGLNLGAFYSLSALGLTVMFGIMGVWNMAHGTTLMLAAVLTFYLYGQIGLNFYVSLMLIVPIVGMLGFIIERILIRPIGGDLGRSFIVTTALLFLMQGIAYLAFGIIPRGVALPITGTVTLLGVGISKYRLVVILIAAILIGGVYYLIHRTRLGLAMRAVEEDSTAASLQGVNLNTINSLVFFFGFALAAAAGVLIAPAYSISPSMGTMLLTKAFMIVALGGLGSVPGAIVGGFLIGLVDSFVGMIWGSSIAYIISWVVVITILIFRPRGLMGAY